MRRTSTSWRHTSRRPGDGGTEGVQRKLNSFCDQLLWFTSRFVLAESERKYEDINRKFVNLETESGRAAQVTNHSTAAVT